MKVENHNGVGNPNHNDANGQFSSGSGGVGGSTPHKIVKNNQVYKVKDDVNNRVTYKSTNNNLNKNQYDVLKKQNKINEYKDQTGINKKEKDYSGFFKEQGFNFDNFMQGYNELMQSKFAKFFRFVLSGFDFNKLKGKKVNLNPRVMKKSSNQTKVNASTPAIENLHKNAVTIDKGLKDTGVNIEHINNLKEIYQEKFGPKNQKQFERWWEKSNLKKSLIANEQKQQQLLAQKEINDKKRKQLNQYLIRNNKRLQGGMK